MLLGIRLFLSSPKGKVEILDRELRILGWHLRNIRNKKRNYKVDSKAYESIDSQQIRFENQIRQLERVRKRFVKHAAKHAKKEEIIQIKPKKKKAA